jgi:hypothetical protein
MFHKTLLVTGKQIVYNATDDCMSNKYIGSQRLAQTRPLNPDYIIKLKAP